MTAILSRSTEITELRDRARLFGIMLSRDQAWTLLRKVSDLGICLDALLLRPRPAWLAEIVGEAA